MEMSRRGLILGGASLIVAAPAIARASSMELVRGVPMDPKVLAFRPIYSFDWYADTLGCPLTPWEARHLASIGPDAFAIKRRSEVTREYPVPEWCWKEAYDDWTDFFGSRPIKEAIFRR